MRFNLFYYKKFFLQEKSERFKIKDIKKQDDSYIFEVVSQTNEPCEIIYNEKIHKLYENRYLKPFDYIKSFFVEDAGMGTADVGLGNTGTQFSGDTYAPGDARNLYGGLPARVQRRNLKGMENLFLKKRKKRNARRKNRKKNKKK